MRTISFTLDDLTFEWDREKAKAVRKKHGVSFEEAASSFSDKNALVLPDPDHSDWEERFLLLGYSARANMLMVSHCLRHSGTVIRLISARKANKAEEKSYHDNWSRH